GIQGVKQVAMHEPLTSLYAVIAIQCTRGMPESEIWRALYGAAALHRFAGKWIIAIDEDIAPENADALLWAMSYRCQPQHDLKVVPHKDPGHGPRGPRDGGESAAVLINATLKGTYAPVALPKGEFMAPGNAAWGLVGVPARNAPAAMAWRGPGTLAAGTRAPSRDGGEERVLRTRQAPGKRTAQRRRHEHADRARVARNGTQDIDGMPHEKLELLT